MNVQLLGTGTSNGIPVIGCDCSVCTSSDPRNRRRRSSALVYDDQTTILIDAGPDLHQQAIGAGITSLDAVLITHAHADHVNGMDDLKPMSWRKSIPLYANQHTLDEIMTRFPYFFGSKGESSRAEIMPRLAEPTGFSVARFDITPIPIRHGQLEVAGYRIGAFAYLLDCNNIPDSSIALLKGVTHLVIDALRPTGSRTHFSFDEAIATATRISPTHAWLSDMCHDVDHEPMDAWVAEQSNGLVHLAWDGMTLSL